MFKKIIPILLCAVLNSCNDKGSSEQGSAKGELKFLLSYNGKLPSEVGFLTNHIVERRLANMMKEKFEAFKNTEGLCELPLEVEGNLIFAHYTSCSDSSVILRNLAFDAEQDAVWVAEKKGGRASVIADNPKLNMPQQLLKFRN